MVKEDRAKPDKDGSLWAVNQGLPVDAAAMETAKDGAVVIWRPYESVIAVVGLSCGCPQVCACAMMEAFSQCRICCGQQAAANVRVGAQATSQTADDTMPASSRMVMQAATKKRLRMLLSYSISG